MSRIRSEGGGEKVFGSDTWNKLSFRRFFFILNAVEKRIDSRSYYRIIYMGQMMSENGIFIFVIVLVYVYICIVSFL